MNIEKYKSKVQRLETRLKEGNHLPALEEGAETHVCLNCQTTYRGNYCPQCGQSSRTKRLSFAHVLESLVSLVTNMERGLLHTLLELCYRPGYMIRDYIRGRRAEYTKPLQLLFVLGTLYFVMHYLCFGGGEEYHVYNPEMDDATQEAFRQSHPVLGMLDELMSNKAWSSLFMVLFLFLPNKWIFNRTEIGKTLSVAEHFFVLVYVQCMSLMLAIVSMPIQLLLQRSALDVKSSGWDLLILVWVGHQLYEIGWFRSLRLNVLSFVVAFTVLILVALVGVGVYAHFAEL